MGSTSSTARHTVGRHRQTIDGSAFFGILLGLFLVLPFWIALVVLGRLLL